MGESRDNTARLAKELWSPEAMELKPVDFQERFDAIYAAGEGPATLWQLGGAANDYLRLHPNSIRIPDELAPKLLDSEIVDSRIVGLKLLNRCSSDTAALSSAICRALESEYEGELYGGLHELGDLLSRLAPSSPLPVEELLVRLSKLRSSRDPYVRECAARNGEQIEGFAST